MKTWIPFFLLICKLVAPTAADEAEFLYKVQENEKWGFINQRGEMVIKPQYDGCYYSFNEGLCAVRKEGKWGYIDRDNRMVIPAKYSGAQNFKNGMAAVLIGEYGDDDCKWVFIDKSGKEFFQTDIEFGYTGFNEGLKEVKNDGKWGFMDTSGKLVIPYRYLDSTSFSEGLAGVQIDDKAAGFINRKGEWAIRLNNAKPHYSGFSEGVAGIFDFNTKKYGYIDRSGNYVIEPQFTDVSGFSEGRATVEVTTKDSTGWPKRRKGVINKKGEWVAQAKYLTVWEYKEGMAKVVTMDHRDGFLDLSGKEAIPCQYSMVDPFHNGLAYVRVRGYGVKDGWSGYINKKGAFVWRPSDYREIEKANTAARIADEKKKKNPSIKIVIGKKTKKKALFISCPEKLYLKGADAGEFGFTLLNHLDDDIFLEITRMKVVSYDVDPIRGGSRSGGGDTRFSNSDLYKLISRVSHDDHNICACRYKYLNSRLPKDALEIGRARGTIDVWIKGYYRSNGKSFFESIHIPVEFLDQERPQNKP